MSKKNLGPKNLCSALVNGQWLTATQEFISYNPANVSDVCGVFAEASSSQIDEAAQCARTAFKTWKTTPAPVRAGIISNFGKLLEINKEALSKCLTREMGKPLREARGDVQEAIDTCHFFVSEGRRLYGQTIPSEMPNKELYTYRRPIGVFACITAGNFPVAVPSWYFIPALIAGNTCVWKPSEDTPLTSYWFTELLLQAGLPKGVFNVVFGTGQVTGDALVKGIDRGLFDKVGFTGSSAVGMRIGEICGRNLQHPCLELGGKNPMVVCPDANLELALQGVLFSGFGTGGQRCTSLGNLIVHESIHDEFVDRLVKKVLADLKIGDPVNEKNFYGPLISKKFVSHHQRHLSELVQSHHQLPLGLGGWIGHGVDWKHFEGDAEMGLYVRPNIVLNVNENDALYSTETFGPLFNVLKYKDLDHAIHLSNAHGFGLSSAIYTQDIMNAYRFRNEITAGMTSINNSTTGAEAHLPFGGNGKSGNGSRQSGIWVMDQFTKWQAVNWDMSGKLQLAQLDTGYVEPNLGFRMNE